MPPIRRLPVLQESRGDDDARPARDWIFIGALFALSIWVPMAMLGGWMTSWVVRRLTGEGSSGVGAEQVAAATQNNRVVLWLAVTILNFSAFAFSCAASGALVGRFGSRAGVREAVLGCGLAALVGTVFSAVRGGWLASVVGMAVLVPVAGLSGWLGGWIGWGLRPPAERAPRRAGGASAGSV